MTGLEGAVVILGGTCFAASLLFALLALAETRASQILGALAVTLFVWMLLRDVLNHAETTAELWGELTAFLIGSVGYGLYFADWWRERHSPSDA